MSRFFFCDINRVNVFAIHRCINEGYGLIPVSRFARVSGLRV